MESPTNSGDSDGEYAESGINSLLNLARARTEIFSYELNSSASSAFRKLILILILAFFLVFGWLLLLVAILVYLVSIEDLSFYKVTAVAAGIHLFIATMASIKLRTIRLSFFPITRDEFKKDNVWLKTLNFQKKSPN